jgi:hypothetical protein
MIRANRRALITAIGALFCKSTREETMPRKWTELDDMAALYIYKFGEGTLMGAFLCAKLKITRAGFAKRVQNFQAIDGQGGLSNYAQQSRHTLRISAMTHWLCKLCLESVSTSLS